jgi:hypothetical protein
MVGETPTHRGPQLREERDGRVSHPHRGQGAGPHEVFQRSLHDPSRLITWPRITNA